MDAVTVVAAASLGIDGSRLAGGLLAGVLRFGYLALNRAPACLLGGSIAGWSLCSALAETPRPQAKIFLPRLLLLVVSAIAAS